MQPQQSPDQGRRNNPYYYHHHTPTTTHYYPPPTNYHQPFLAQPPPINYHYPPPPPNYYNPLPPTTTTKFQSPTSTPPHSPLLRGSLAQAKLRTHSNYQQLEPLQPQFHHQHHPHPHHHHPNNKPALPKPPIHSQYALWVGNIPNDASQEELYKFFSHQHTGVESIHLIARSNCAFVNYISQAHLTQAISSSNGKPLRPLDPYCKPLLCRIRKPEDNLKSGVGAQRIGGLHRSWIKRINYDSSNNQNIHHHQPKHSQSLPSSSIHPNLKTQTGIDQQPHSKTLNEPPNLRTSSTLTAVSNQSQSTTSSFLTSHFPKRYFILKAYTDQDLRISVERSIWVSQTHNEPILDQAYRTSTEGVYLIFSANQSGSFFGYARMAGPIVGARTRPKSLPPSSPPSAHNHQPSGRTRRSASIATPDRSLDDLFADLPPSASPRALSPVLQPDLPVRWPGSPVHRSLPILAPAKNHHHQPNPPNLVSTSPLSTLIHLHHSQSTLPSTVLTPSDHYDHHQTPCSDHLLSQLDHPQPSTIDDDEQEDKLMSGKPFKVEWIRVQKLSFYRTKNLRNPFNGNREVKVSRDGTEVEPSIGAAIVAEIENEFRRHQNHQPHHHHHQQQQHHHHHRHHRHHHQPHQSTSSSSALTTVQDQLFHE